MVARYRKVSSAPRKDTLVRVQKRYATASQSAVLATSPPTISATAVKLDASRIVAKHSRGSEFRYRSNSTLRGLKNPMSAFLS